ncbi:MAG: Rieske 2Fe-2S domain-containing protein [Halobacteriales archaeon]
MSTTDDRLVEVGPVDEVREEAPARLTTDGQAIGVFYHDGTFYATDIRCPHMGFPLTQGTIEDGILTCHWHHARFELECGDTLDPFADDVRTYPVEVRDDRVYVDPTPMRDRTPEEHWRDRLEHGLEEDLSLIVAKAAIGLDDAGVDPAVPIAKGVEFGTSYREQGWGRGLTTLGVMANLLPALRPADRRRALYVGLSEVADESAGAPPRFPQDPLSNPDIAPARLKRWFRDSIEVRDSDGAERVLRAAVQADLSEDAVAGMLVAAATDHLYLDAGHRLDFINKAFETLEHVGWEHADTTLASLAPGLADAGRAEEQSSWRKPVDVAALCFEAAEELPDLLEAGRDRTWSRPAGFVDDLLSDDPRGVMATITDAIAAGAAASDLAGAVCEAAARRIVQFGTANEFRDWNTVHHTYTYANAVDGLARRTSAPERYRGIFDAAMSVYLDRFLNIPPQPVPDPDGDGDPTAVLEDLLATFEVEDDREINRAGRMTAEYLASDGDVDRLREALGEALLREDVGFHPRQNVEVAFTQFDRVDSPERGRIHLVATARYLAAHTPTRREGEQTFKIAERLSQGERLHE